MNKVGSAAHGITDSVLDKVGNVIDGLDDLGPAVENLKHAGQSSNALAKETTELCQSTHSKSQQMMEFCNDLKETFGSSTEGGTITADKLDTIQELLSGEKVQTAMGLAKEMSEYAKTCVEKSVQMVS